MRILSKGQTGVMDRGYQFHKDFDLLQKEGKHFVCRIKSKTTRTIIEKYAVNPGSHVFYDALVLLGTPNQNQTAKPVRVVGYEISGVKYYVAADRHDLTAEQIASVYKLRWTIENFFKWWKEHLKVYHLIVRRANMDLWFKFSQVLSPICCWRSTAGSSLTRKYPLKGFGSCALQS